SSALPATNLRAIASKSARSGSALAPSGTSRSFFVNRFPAPGIHGIPAPSADSTRPLRASTKALHSPWSSRKAFQAAANPALKGAPVSPSGWIASRGSSLGSLRTKAAIEAGGSGAVWAKEAAAATKPSNCRARKGEETRRALMDTLLLRPRSQLSGTGAPRHPAGAQRGERSSERDGVDVRRRRDNEAAGATRPAHPRGTPLSA